MLLSDVANDPRFKNHLLAGSRVADYMMNYHREMGQALLQVDPQALEAALNLMMKVIDEDRTLFVCGNGGSAAIAEHLSCDWMKGTRGTDGRTLRVISLTSNCALNSALANDYGYEKVFSAQLEMQARAGDVLVLISSSGNSPNIMAALQFAQAKGMATIGMSGFSGGQLAKAADVKLYVPVDNYGIVEDAHQVIMHSLAQSLVKRYEAGV